VQVRLQSALYRSTCHCMGTYKSDANGAFQSDVTRFWSPRSRSCLGCTFGGNFSSSWLNLSPNREKPNSGGDSVGFWGPPNPLTVWQYRGPKCAGHFLVPSCYTWLDCTDCIKCLATGARALPRPPGESARGKKGGLKKGGRWPWPQDLWHIAATEAQVKDPVTFLNFNMWLGAICILQCTWWWTIIYQFTNCPKYM